MIGPWAEGGDGLLVATGGAGPHSGTGFIATAGLSNPWAFYTFSGDFTAGRTYTFGFWSRVNGDAAPATVTFGYDTGTSFPSFTGTTATLTIPDPETEWTYHELAWTAPSDISSSGSAGGTGVKFLLEYGASSTDAFDLDDGSLCEL